MARVDGHVIDDAFMNNCCLVLGHSWNPIWPQGLPRTYNFAVAFHADPKHPEATKGRSQPILTLATTEKYIVNDDAGPTADNRGNTDVPGRLKALPPGTDIDLSGFPNMKERTILEPFVGHRPDQVVDAE